MDAFPHPESRPSDHNRAPVQQPPQPDAEPTGAPNPPGHLTKLGRQECLRLLGSVALGRVVFTLGALPAIRPVNHVLIDDDIIIRTHLNSGIISATGNRRDVVVAYEADDIDPFSHTGWSVVATGIARLVRNSADVTHLENALRPWTDQQMDCVIRIRPELVTGYRLNPVTSHSTSSGNGKEPG